MKRKFVRERTRNEELQDVFINSFQKTGFINEELYDTTDRDITDAYFGMLSNVYNMGIYDSILIGYKKIEYSEEVLQTEELGKLSEKEIKRLGGGVFALTHPLFYKMYKCVYIKTPVSFGKKKDKNKNSYTIVQPKMAAEIKNTLRIINEEINEEYTIIPHVREFLESQLKKQVIVDMAKFKSSTEDLFIRNPKTDNSIVKSVLFIPMLKDNAYYEDNGNKRYPYITEKYNYHKTALGQVQFHTKEITKADKANRTLVAVLSKAYLTIRIPKDGSSEIFTIRQYAKYFNPFTFVDRKVAERLYKRLINNPILTVDTYELVKSTYENYLTIVDDIESGFGNAIPAIAVMEVPKDNEIKLDTPDDITNEVNSDIELGEDYIGEQQIEDVEEEVRRSRINKAKGYTTIDDLTIESIILGHNGKKVFSFYDHIMEYYLRVFISTGANKKKSGSYTLENKDIPKAFQLVATINQNPDLFMSSGLTHPLDAFMCLSYKKYLFYTPTINSKSTDGVDDKERYLDWKSEYQLIDVITTKSENSSGLQASVLGYKRIADRFEFKKFKNK